MSRGEKSILVLMVGFVMMACGWSAWRFGNSRLPAIARPDARSDGSQNWIREIRTDQLEAQPLFDPLRTPPVEIPSASASAPAGKQPNPVLRGVAGSPDRMGALLEDGLGGQRKLVFAGQTFGAWTVEEVEARRVQLKSGDLTLDLTLRGERPATPASGAANVGGQ